MPEKTCFFILRGYYRAAYAREILIKSNLPSRIVKAPAHLGIGCCYALEIQPLIYDESLKILKRENIIIEDMMCCVK